MQNNLLKFLFPTLLYFLVADAHKLQARWEKRILKSINTMCSEKSIPLARMRTIREQADFTQVRVGLAHI